MKFDQDKLQIFRENVKTQFLMTQYDMFLKKLDEAISMADTDPEMAELAAEEVKETEGQLEGLYKEMDKIIEAKRKAT